MRVNRARLADVVGVAPKTISAWLDEGLPRVRQGAQGLEDEYDTAEVIRWMIARETGSKDENGNVIVFEAERARLTKEQADKVAMDNAIKRGDLMQSSEVAKHWASIIVNTKTRLLAIPTKAAPMVMGAKSLPVVRETIERFVIEALNELMAADHHPDGRSSAGMEATAEADGEPVGGPPPEVKPRGKRRARAVGD